MTLVSDVNARASYTNADALKEDVLDTVINVAPMAVPFLAQVNRGPRCLNENVEWILDYTGAYPASIGAVSQRGEGDDASPTATRTRYKANNRTSNIGDSKSVTHTQNLIAQHGIANELAYQAEDLAQDLLRHVEMATLNAAYSADTTNAPNSSGTNRSMGGLIEQITTPATFGLTSLATEAKAATANQAGTALAASDLNSLLRTMWTNGGIVDGQLQALVGPSTKELFNDLFAPHASGSSIYRRHFGQVSERKIDLPVDIISAESAEVHLHKCRAVADEVGVGGTTTTGVGEIIFFNPGFVELRVLRDMEYIELAKLGDSHKFMIVWEGTICLLAPNTASRLGLVGT